MSAPDPDGSYAQALLRAETKPWKQLLDVQGPYRRRLKALNLGYTLDLGCGVGRHLQHLNGVGIDRDPVAVALARKRSLQAFTPAAFATSEHARPGQFDSLLLSHVVEHLTFDEAVELVRLYLPCLRPGGRVVFITPQAAGFRRDPTHVLDFDPPRLRRLVETGGLVTLTLESFPFPPLIGRVFPFNEWILVAAVRAH